MEATRTATVRVGIIGVGRIGRMHAELLAHQVPGASVSLVHDAREDTAREVASELGVATAAPIVNTFGSDPALPTPG